SGDRYSDHHGSDADSGSCHRSRQSTGRSGDAVHRSPGSSLKKRRPGKQGEDKEIMKIARSMLLAAVAVFVIATAAAPAQAGGKMVVTFKDDVSTLDPAIGYDWQNWSMIK